MKDQFKEIFRFAITGIISTITIYAVYYICLGFVVPSVAFLVGYLFAFLVNYFLTVTFTFKVKVSTKNGAGFIVSNLVNFFLNEFFLNLFIHMGITEKWAPVPMFAVCVPINFLLVRFVMKKL